MGKEHVQLFARGIGAVFGILLDSRNSTIFLSPLMTLTTAKAASVKYKSVCSKAWNPPSHPMAYTRPPLSPLELGTARVLIKPCLNGAKLCPMVALMFL